LATPICALCGDSHSRLRFQKQDRDFLECQRCGLVWIDPLPSPADVADRYSDAYSAGEYAAFARARGTRDLISEHRLEIVRNQVKPGRWLDVGCATGSFVAAAVAQGCAAEGLDASREAVEITRERGLTAHHGRVEDFTPPQLYDVITAFDVLEHAIDPRAFVKRLGGWLGSRGSLVLTLPDVRSVYATLLMRKHWFYFWPDEHLFYFDPETIARLLEEEGFEVQKLTRAYKPLSLEYAAKNLEVFNQTLGRVASATVGLLPRRLRERPFRFYLGEMLVLARRVAGTA
jgi:2-polyprenyl-3-methyl-5-hydroxy-6-metoxy-1,4-benzoquinol methylase